MILFCYNDFALPECWRWAVNSLLLSMQEFAAALSTSTLRSTAVAVCLSNWNSTGFGSIFIQSALIVSVILHRESFATFSLIAREKIWPHGHPRLNVFTPWHKAGGWKNANDHVFSCRISSLRAPGLKWGDNSVLEPIMLAFSCKLL